MSLPPFCPRLLTVGLSFLVSLIAGCGGGGGGAAASPNSPVAPTWSQQAYVKAFNAGSNNEFGFSVALSGDTLVVGAEGEASSQTTITNGSTATVDKLASSAGAVYVFVRSGSSWSQQAYLKAPNAETQDRFGSRVAISGDTLVVGAYQESSNQTVITNGGSASSDNSALQAGAAYVFVRSGTNWSQQAYLKAPNADARDYFGGGVAISGDTIVIGAYGEDSSQTTVTAGSSASSDNSIDDAGAAYVFVRNGVNWSQQAYLKAPNAEAGDRFGYSVAINGDTIVVGAPFESSNQTTVTNGSNASADNAALWSGAAYVFVRSGTNWSQQAYLKAPNVGAGDLFGLSLGLSSDTLVVGAYHEQSNQTTITNGSSASSNDSAESAGAAYVFVRSGTSWSQQAYLKAPNADVNDYFGFSVAIGGDTIAVGAVGEASSQTSITNGSTASADNSAVGTGAAYVFVRSGTSWSQQAYLKAPNAKAGAHFGVVAVGGDTIAVGAYAETSNQTTIINGSGASADSSVAGAGAAYVFQRAN